MAEYPRRESGKSTSAALGEQAGGVIAGFRCPWSDDSGPKRPWRAARIGLAGLLLALALPAAGAEPALVSIGTGGKTGVYYLVGGAICDLVNGGGGRRGCGAWRRLRMGRSRI